MATNKSTEKVKQKKTDILQSLVLQLEAKNAKTPHFLDMINDYMNLWELKNKLNADIKKRGVTYKTHTATGIEVIKQNQSVKDVVMVNRQMLSLLDQLGLRTDKPTGVVDKDAEDIGL